VARAVTRGLVQITLHNFRAMATDRHHTVDDYPYGGGAGMVLKPEPLFAAVEAASLPAGASVALLTPQGVPFSQAVAHRLASRPALALLCGHYEGVDERVRLHLATEEISLGDFVLSGGEIAAMAVTDAVVRLLPGVIDAASMAEESHQAGLLEYPQYTRPPDFRGWRVPDVLLSGDHGRIARWRREEALRRTWERRPDMLRHADLSGRERQLLDTWPLASPQPEAGAVPGQTCAEQPGATAMHDIDASRHLP
jgi:tRNA (guanine37-N1)-methyltransferase